MKNYSILRGLGLLVLGALLYVVGAAPAPAAPIVGAKYDLATGAFTEPTASSFGSIRLTGSGNTEAQVRAGAFGLQSQTSAEGMITTNIVYVEGTGFVYRATGAAGVIYMGGGEMQFTPLASASGGSTTSLVPALKVHTGGVVALGGSINNTSGNYSGAALLVDGNGATLTGGGRELTIGSYSETESQARIGGFEIQSYDQLTGWLGQNTYHLGGTGYIRRTTGPASLLTLRGDELQVAGAPSGTAGTVASELTAVMFKVSGSGEKVGMGGTMPYNTGDFGGASLVAGAEDVTVTVPLLDDEGNPYATKATVRIEVTADDTEIAGFETAAIGTVFIASDSASASARTITLPAGVFDGQEVRLVNATANAWEIQAIGTREWLPATFTAAASRDNITLVWDSEDESWLQVAATNY
jgi:hypothetical protein